MHAILWTKMDVHICNCYDGHHYGTIQFSKPTQFCLFFLNSSFNIFIKLLESRVGKATLPKITADLFPVHTLTVALIKDGRCKVRTLDTTR